jgi:hypothetical protein
MPTTQYDLKSVKLPRLAGAALRVFANLLESPATRGLLIGKLLRDGGITNIRALRIDEPPIPPSFGLAQDRAFGASWFSGGNVFSFRGAFAAESAGGSVSRHAAHL